jgi:enterochelin esterase family protein
MDGCRIVHEWIDSAVLAGNPLGDPARRDTAVILPPGYDGAPRRRYPVIYLLASFTATGWQQLNRSPLSESLDERLSRLFTEDPALPPAIVVLPDCMTALGGSQYVNSVGLGRYEDHIVEEVVPLIDRRYRTLAAPQHRAVLGRSSGGIGALWLAMNHPDLFQAVGSHAGDMYFRLTQVPEILKFCRRVRRYGGPGPLLEKLRTIGKGPRTSDLFDLMSFLACALAYGDTVPPELALPVDWETGRLREEVFARWLRFDPVEICGKEPYRSALHRQRLIYLDAGTRDEYHLDLGARLLAARLRALEIAPERLIHEEFDDGHMNTAYRYDRSLPLLIRAIGAPA